MKDFILGSHNTMSYLRPKTWWGRLFRFVAQCQSKAINEQWEAGVRYYDLRVAFPKERQQVSGIMTLGKIANACAYFCHGLIDFESGRPEDIVSYLNMQAYLTGDKVYVRMILEKENSETCVVDDVALFKALCQNWRRKYKNLTFVSGRRKSDWVKLYDFRTIEPTLDDKYSSMTWKVLDDWCPRLYAWLMNKKNLKRGTNKDVLFIDFV